MKKTDAEILIKPAKKLDCFLADSEALIKEAKHYATVFLPRKWAPN